jgi:branched-chain amino acid transport system ATP-binding protein
VQQVSLDSGFSERQQLAARAPILLQIENLRLGYGSAVVVDGLDLAIRKGEISGIVGANGAGKTTLLKGISALIRKRAGTIVFEDQEIHALTPRRIVRAGVAQVAEGHRVFRKMTVAENLRLGAYPRRPNAQQFDANLQRVYSLFPVLEARAQVRAGALSGGQQQMVAIGQAMMASPTLLLMDEPSSGLSPTVIDDLVTSLAELRAAGVTLLVVEQRTAFIREIADRIWVMQRGSMVVNDLPAEECTDEKLASVYLGAAAGGQFNGTRTR